MVLLNIHIFSLSNSYFKKTSGEHEDKHWQHKENVCIKHAKPFMRKQSLNFKDKVTFMRT